MSTTAPAPTIWSPEEFRLLNPLEQIAVRMQAENGTAVLLGENEVKRDD